ncbi:neuraminidase-like domain-containing protein [Streptomyces sp. NPDC059443]|uniref:Tc toxin subunit A-related protein n=1 Tax=unclassified Streptomyces TaxID=2593676 RepID=UPI0036A45F83
MTDIPLFALTATNIGTRGPAVARLHLLLARLGIGEVPGEEAAEERYGERTTVLVKQLQRMMRLDSRPPVSGQLDAGTARGANDLAFGRGLFRVVHGHVLGAAGTSQTGAVVSITDASNPDVPCALTSTETEGYYRAYYDPHFYRDQRFGVANPVNNIQVVVRAEADGAAVHSAPRPNRRILVVDLALPATADHPPRYVRGSVVDENGAPVDGVHVEVFDRDAGTAVQRLGDPGRGEYSETGLSGTFQVVYDASAYARGEGEEAGKLRADLVFKLTIKRQPWQNFTLERCPAYDGEQFAGAGPVSALDQNLGIQGRDVEVVTIHLKGYSRPPGPSEFTRLMSALKPLTRTTPLVDFNETRTQDISFAAREIGEERALVADLVAAHKLAALPFARDTAPEVFYGFARVLGITDAAALAARPVTDLVAALTRAVQDNVIPEVKDPQGVTVRLQKAAAQCQLDTPGSDAAVVDQALRPVIEKKEKRQEIALLAVNHEGAPEDFWKDLKHRYESLSIPRIQFAIQLTNLADGNPGLVTALQEAAPKAQSMRTLALDLDDRLLANAIAESQASPADRLPDEEDQKARLRLQSQILGLLEASQPTSIVARMARRWATEKPDTVSPAAAGLLERAVRQTDFELATSDVTEFTRSHFTELFTDAQERERSGEAIAGLLRLQRLFRVSIGTRTAELLATGTSRPYQGALDIAQYGKSAFLASFEPSEPREAAATRLTQSEVTALERVYDRSRSIAGSVAALMIAQYQDEYDAKPLWAANGKQDDPAAGADPSGAALAPHAAGVARWTDFFGSVEQCECDECRSVTGPAAYFVALLQYLHKGCKPGKDGLTPGDRLTALRPDLQHIKLTCQNVNTSLPTIDLINQILESRVAFNETVPLKTGADGEPVLPNELQPNEMSPGATDRLLSAGPEHLIQKAYDLLAEADYPMILPYDRPLATARVHFKQAGTSRAEAMSLFRPEAAGEIAAESLGLLRRDFEILTGTTFRGTSPKKAVVTQELFGNTTPPLPHTARAALAALGLSFEELVALLRTRFAGGLVPDADDAGTAARLLIDVGQLTALRAANYVVSAESDTAKLLEAGGLTAKDVENFVKGLGERFATTLVLDPPGSCDPDAIGVRHLDGSDVDEPQWLRLHRFVRLARRMGIAFGDLDVALAAVADDVAPPAFSARTLQRLAALTRLRASLDLTWPAAAALVADIDTHGPDSLYDHLFVVTGLDRSQTGFRRQEDGSVLSDGSPMPLKAGLPVLATAFATSPEELSAAADQLKIETVTLDGVSQLYRVTRLATAVGVRPAELVVLQKIYSLSGPYAAWQSDPAQVATFVEWARLLLGAGVSTDLLALLTTPPPDQLPGLSAEGRTALIADVGRAYDAATERDTREADEEQQQRPENPKFTAEQLAARRKARSDHRDELVAKVLGPVCRLDPAFVARLLTALPSLEVLRHTVAPQDGFEKLLAGLDRIGRLRAATGLPETQFAAATTHAQQTSDQALEAVLTGKDPTVVLAIVRDIALFADLATRTLRPTALASAVLELSAGATDWPAKAISAGAEWLRLDAALVEDTVHIGLSVLAPADARLDPLPALAALRRCTLMASRLGHAPREVPDLLAEPLSQPSLVSLISGVSSGFAPTSWPEVSRQLADPIREASRDALVAYLLHRDKLRDAEQLFEECLVDTGISPFALTSPIRQAIFAIHTFVQRCQLGVVEGVDPSQLDLDEWAVLQSKPLWSAQLETLLYPHWLLDPSWRDNKSVLFKAEESALRQADVTPANTVQSYHRYLAGLSEVSTLEVCGSFLQTKFEGREEKQYTSVLHVVGRTRSSVTRKYFYRRLNQGENYREWTDWEPVEADIQGVEQDRTEPRTQDGDADLVTPGVHLLPVVWRGQVYLFWPTFVRKSEGRTQPPEVDVTHPQLKAELPRPYWDVKLSWTRREPVGWTPKQQSGALAETWWRQDYSSAGFYDLVGLTPAPQLPDPSTLLLQAQVDETSGQLSVVLCSRWPDTSARRRLAFVFDRATSEVRAQSTFGTGTGDHPAFIADGSTVGCYQGIRMSGAVRAIADPEHHPAGDVLFTPQNPVSVITLNQGFTDGLRAPLFIDLGDRAYFATTQHGAGGALLLYADPPPASLLTAGERVRLMDAAASAPQLAVGSPANPWWAEKAAAMAGYSLAEMQSTGPTATGGVSAASAAKTGNFDPVLVGLDPPGGKEKLPITFPPVQWIGYTALDLAVTPFSHALAGTFQTILHQEGIGALLSPETQKKTLDSSDTFAARCDPDWRRTTFPAVEGVDFSPDSPFGNTNWEIFFHLPDLIRKRLADNKQLDAAFEMQRTFFDPLNGSANPDDSWLFLPLRDAKPVRLEDMLATLSLPAGDPARVAMDAQIEAMHKYPFQAHRIARLRPLAYKKWAVIEAVRLQLAISKEFHARFPNPEAFNRAFQPCLLAKALLGPRPEVVKPRASMAPRSYAELRPDLDALGNVLLTAESKLAPLAAAAGTASGTASSTQTAGLVQRGAIGYFGIPPDRKLLALWDEAEDRLFKLRNSMTLDGEQIQLPLYPPRIDPAALAEAIGTGMTIDQILDALGATRPPQRFQAAYREAVADAQRLIAIGDALLAAEEQYDNETMAHTRAVQEQAMASMILSVRDKQRAVASGEQQEAYAQRDEHVHEWHHYQELLGLPPLPDPTKVAFATPGRKLALVPSESVSFEDLQVIPDLVGSLVTAAGGAMGAATGGALNGAVGAGVAHAAVDAVNESVGGTTMAPGNILEEEKQQLQESFKAVRLTFEAALLDTLAAAVGIIPTFEGAMKPFGAGAAIHFGGQALAGVARAGSGNKTTAAGMHRFLSSVYEKQAGVVLREREWVAALNRAAHAVREADQRIATAALRIASHQAEYDAQNQALKDAAAIEKFLSEKFTRAELHDWRRQHLHDLFRRSCDVAMESFEAVSCAYRWQREWTDGVATLPRVSRPTSAREELLFGHDLMTCLQEFNRRFQSTEQVGPQAVHRFSLREIDPWALYDLRETGRASFSLPEVLFDIDHPEHYDRRIKGVQISVLCNRGPLMGIGGTLTLDRSKRRAAPTHTAEDLKPDPRLGTNSIALSTGQNDTGMFEVNPELFQPFEGMGAVSDWTLSLPEHFRRYPYREISDVVLTLQINARTGGDAYGATRSKNIREALNVLRQRLQSDGTAKESGIHRLISLQHDRSADWATFQATGKVATSVGVQDLSHFMRNDDAPDPTLHSVVAVGLHKGKPVGATVPLDMAVTGSEPLWSVTLAAPDLPPTTTEDILLLARFDL